MLNLNGFLMNIIIFSGGVGGARFLYGLKHANTKQDYECTVISNTGDDFYWYGLKICPDIDTVIYHLTEQAGKFGWGIIDDTFNILSNLSVAKLDDWFKIGDKDLVTHLMRSSYLKEGKTLSELTALIAKHYDFPYQILPVTDDECPTFITTANDDIVSFQEYFAKRQFQDEVKSILFPHNEVAKPAPGVIEAIQSADLIVFPPSNPFLSIEPMLKIPSIKNAIIKSHANKIAISPLINGKAVKGPLSKILIELGFQDNVLSIADYYKDLVDTIFIDSSDGQYIEQINNLGITAEVANILMIDKNLSPQYTSEILNRII